MEFRGRGAVTSGVADDAADTASDEGIDSTAEEGVSACGWELLVDPSSDSCSVEVANAVSASVSACT